MTAFESRNLCDNLHASTSDQLNCLTMPLATVPIIEWNFHIWKMGTYAVRPHVRLEKHQNLIDA